MEEDVLEENDKKVRIATYAYASKEMALLDQMLLHINHGLAQLTGQKHDRDLNFLSGLLLNRAFNSLWRAREDAACGYPAEALTLCRSVVEHWATVRWVEFHPERAKMWLWAILDEVEEPTERLPSTDAMLTELATLGAHVKQLYNLLSKFAHPKSTGLAWVIHYDEETTYFHSGAHFDERGIRMCLYFLLGAAQACLEPVARLQNRMLGTPDDEWLARGRELSERAQVVLTGLEDEVEEEGARIAPRSEGTAESADNES